MNPYFGAGFLAGFIVFPTALKVLLWLNTRAALRRFRGQ